MFDGAYAKEEGNCNAKVTWPINHIYFRLKSYILQPQLFSPLVWFRHRYDPSSILALTRIQPSQPISTSSLRRKSPTGHSAVVDQAEMLEHKLIERLLAGCRYVIQVMNYVVDRSDFKEQIMQTIDQTRAIQSKIRLAIKAIWSAIRSRRTRRWLHCQ